MSNFIPTEQLTTNVELQFGTITTNSLQKFTCKNGEIAGFQIQACGLGPTGETLYISQIFDCSSGDAVLLGSTSTLPGLDLTKGYFSSGCYPTADVFLATTRFFKQDYP